MEMLLMAGALPNFSSRQFSYVGPSLSALVEYLTYCENCDCALVRLLLQYGAHVSFRLPTRLLKIRQPSGVLGQVSILLYTACQKTSTFLFFKYLYQKLTDFNDFW